MFNLKGKRHGVRGKPRNMHKYYKSKYGGGKGPPRHWGESPEEYEKRTGYKYENRS